MKTLTRQDLAALAAQPAVDPAEWIRVHALEVLQTELGCPVRLEVGHGQR